MTTYLLDANVLIALGLDDHVHHQRCQQWLTGVDDLAVCPVVEGALVRFLVRNNASGSTARAFVDAVRAWPGVEFWPDSLSYADADLGHVRGHRQVTDAYLLALARSHPDAVVATLDEGLVAVGRGAAVLV